MFVVNGRFLTQKATGIQRYAFEICNKLHEWGVDFYVVAPKEINPEYKFNFRIKQFGTFSGHLWEQLSLPKYLKDQGNPLLVSFSGCGPINYSNQIITIHDVSHELHPEWFSKNYYRFYHFAFPLIGKKAHAVITVSEFSKREIIQSLGIASEKIHVIHSNVPFHNKPSAESIINYVPDKEKGKFIIAVSNMDPRKNFIRLVDAFNNMKDKSIKLYIIGMKFKAFNSPDMQKHISDNVILPGFIDDETLQQMYKDALFSVYPSLYEGFGLPPLESMTYGCPTIIADIPALREISQDAALYVDPLSVNDITNKMDLLAEDDDLRRRLRLKGLEQIKKYSWDKSSKMVLELVNQYS